MTDTTPPTSCEVCACDTVTTQDEWTITFECEQSYYKETYTHEWKRDDSHDTRCRQAASKVSNLRAAAVQLRQQLEQAIGERDEAVKRGDTYRNRAHVCFRDARFVHTQRRITNEIVGELMTANSELRAQAAPAPLGGIVWAATRLVEECRDEYNITLGAYMCEPILFQDLMKVVDELTANDAPAQGWRLLSEAARKTLDYWKRNGLGNFQFEKMDDYMRMIEQALDDEQNDSRRVTLAAQGDK